MTNRICEAAVRVFAGRVVATLVLVHLGNSHAHPEPIDWIQQLGTSEQDWSFGVSSDGHGGVYIAGGTHGALNGENAGVDDAFIAKYDANGELQWTQQLGTSESDSADGVSADGQGNIYVSGTTKGSLGGPYVGGEDDTFLAKYDASGALQWTRQLGSEEADGNTGVATDGLGNTFVTGRTFGALGAIHAGEEDAFLAKYDASGALAWTRQLGTSADDASRGIASDGQGNAYITGFTFGDLSGESAGYADPFLAKYDADGNLQWTHQFGSDHYDRGFAVASDGDGSAYVAGYTRGNMHEVNAGETDAFITKFDASGTLVWTRQLGTSLNDIGLGVSTDTLGNAYIAGFTEGDLQGTNTGDDDAFVAKYDPSGAIQWIEQFGTGERDAIYFVAADGPGDLYATGFTFGTLGETVGGGRDAFLMKFAADEPEFMADFNRDLAVDDQDCEIWELNFGNTGATHSIGDANGDGQVTGADFLIWQRQFGADGVSAAEADREGVEGANDLMLWQGSVGMITTRTTIDSMYVVPEPASSMLLTMAVILHGYRRRYLPVRRAFRL